MKFIQAMAIVLVMAWSGIAYAADGARQSGKKCRGHSAKTSTASCCAAEATQTAPQDQSRQEPSEKNKDTESQSVTVTLTDAGYQPSSFKLRKDLPAKVTFVRQAEKTCGTEIVIPEYHIKRDLPLGAPVVMEFTPTKSGEFAFTCGMGMLRGKIVIQ